MPFIILGISIPYSSMLFRHALQACVSHCSWEPVVSNKFYIDLQTSQILFNNNSNIATDLTISESGVTILCRYILLSLLC